ncbi:MAG: BtrH N-terminal domain-containing protein [Candidatus Thorarchaeota archaeon]
MGDIRITNKYLVNNFIHRVGLHCESSSMRDLFEYHGFPMSEAMAFGLDATMGFGFFDTTNSVSFIPESDVPFFLGGKQGTIEPNSLACRLLGINLRKQSFSSADKAWEESKKLINQDIPLILQIDLGYLPYFEEAGELHFGGHAITLAGYDEEEGIAYVGDTEYDGFQEVAIEKLKEGRSSDFGPKFMHPNNSQYSMKRRLDGKHPPLAAGVKVAIQRVANNMLRPSVNNQGIAALKLFASSIPQWEDKLKGEAKDPQGKTTSRSRLMFELMHGYIETWGTGGASFRNLYKGFLEELLTHPELKKGPKAWTANEFKILEDCIPIIEDSAKNWTKLAEVLLNAANEHKNDCLNHVDLTELHNIAHEILLKEENLFKNLMKLKI